MKLLMTRLNINDWMWILWKNLHICFLLTKLIINILKLTINSHIFLINIL